MTAVKNGGAGSPEAPPGGAAGARPKVLTPETFLWPERYEAERPARRKALMETKRRRRLAVGPHATFHFENHETMWYQVQEMLRIERGGEEQLRDEIAAYGPLVPQGRELVATVMFEIADPERRAEILANLGGVEERMSISVGERRIGGVPEADLDRTSADGKASSVQFVRFPFDDAALEDMRSGRGRVVVAIEHPAYAHMAVMPDETRRAVCEDFDP